MNLAFTGTKFYEKFSEVCELCSPLDNDRYHDRDYIRIFYKTTRYKTTRYKTFKCETTRYGGIENDQIQNDLFLSIPQCFNRCSLVQNFDQMSPPSDQCFIRFANLDIQSFERSVRTAKKNQTIRSVLIYNSTGETLPQLGVLNWGS